MNRIDPPTNKEFVTTIGSLICIIGGPVLLILSSTAEPINLWGIVGGALLVTLGWKFALECGLMAGRSEGRLEEREKRKKEQ